MYMVLETSGSIRLSFFLFQVELQFFLVHVLCVWFSNFNFFTLNLLDCQCLLGTFSPNKKVVKKRSNDKILHGDKRNPFTHQIMSFGFLLGQLTFI